MAKKINPKNVAAMMVTSLMVGAIPVQASNSVLETEAYEGENIKITKAYQTTGESIEIRGTTGSMIKTNETAETLIRVETAGNVNLLSNASFEQLITVKNGHQKEYWKDARAPKDWNNIWIPRKGANLKIGLDTSEYTQGMQSVYIDAPNTSRIAFMNTIPFDPNKAYRLSMDIKTKDVSGRGAYFRVQYLDSKNKKTQVALPSSNIVKGTTDWKDYNITLKDIPKDTSKLKIEVYFENAIGKAWYDNMSLVETYDFKLSQSKAKQVVGDSLQLEGIFGQGASNKNLTWASSNEQIATVNQDGKVTMLAPGAVTITATTIDKNIATCNISVEDEAFLVFYKQLRQKWSDYHTTNNIKNPSDSNYMAEMERLTQRATELLRTMNRYDGNTGDKDKREELWPQYETAKNSAHITSTIKNLRTLTIAYKAKGSGLYNNEELGKEIQAGLEWFYAKRYNENQKIYTNWWDWDIGIPQPLNDILVMLYDELSQEQLDNYLRAISHFVPKSEYVIGGPNPLTGANLLDAAFVCTVRGILEESNEPIARARDSVSAVLPYVTKGDGFYEDGSFIQHKDIPYAGGYGGVLMSRLAQLIYITDETPWEVTDPAMENVYDWIIHSFEPLYYKGAIMDMVSGRGVSREKSNDHNKGKDLLHKMLVLAESAPEPKRRYIKQFVKENVENDLYCKEDYFSRMNMNDVIAVKELLADETIPARGDLNLHKVYGAMDRIVHHRPGFSMGISMFSTRTSAFEIGNGENKKPWHTGDGMMYLYNDDIMQYTDNYWPTADMMRLPGTTTDHSERKLKDWYSYRSSKSWVGGSSIHDLYGATGMEFEMEPGKSTLTGKKSWFSFNDEVVALGAGINAKDDTLVETIIENRKIKDNGENKLIINSIERVNNLNSSEKVEQASWAFLEGNTEEGTDTIGYYFPGDTTVTAKKETRTGAWNDINNGGTKTPITKNYASIAIEHGKNPINATYSYVLLPNKSKEQVEAYSKNPDITILANMQEVQAVRENKLQILGANFWGPATIEYITAQNPCSIMIDESNGKLAVGISDPTHLQKEVKVILDKPNYKLITKDDSIGVKTTGNAIEIIINTERTMGKTHHMELAVVK